MVAFNTSTAVWILDSLACMGGCFGCFISKPTPITAVDEPAKGLRIRGQVVRSDDFWSTRTGDLEQSAVQSQRSMSSISLSNQNPGNGSAASTDTTEFVNNSFLLWQQSRLQWIGSSVPRNQTRRKSQPRLSWNDSYEGLLGNRNPFPQHIPLSEMVSFLVEVWEQEGLY